MVDHIRWSNVRPESASSQPVTERGMGLESPSQIRRHITYNLDTRVCRYLGHHPFEASGACTIRTGRHLHFLDARLEH